ncbi:hypothetical protein HKX48_005913 [Thoreauomyces humboldtii]|nr:hypothetical protein HKX48_005913 [Thoreauomyces humboldtii]
MQLSIAIATLAAASATLSSPTISSAPSSPTTASCDAAPAYAACHALLPSPTPVSSQSAANARILADVACFCDGVKVETATGCPAVADVSVGTQCEKGELGRVARAINYGVDSDGLTGVQGKVELTDGKIWFSFVPSNKTTRILTRTVQPSATPRVSSTPLPTTDVPITIDAVPASSMAATPAALPSTTLAPAIAEATVPVQKSTVLVQAASHPAAESTPAAARTSAAAVPHTTSILSKAHVDDAPTTSDDEDSDPVVTSAPVASTRAHAASTYPTNAPVSYASIAQPTYPGVAPVSYKSLTLPTNAPVSYNLGLAAPTASATDAPRAATGAVPNGLPALRPFVASTRRLLPTVAPYITSNILGDQVSAGGRVSVPFLYLGALAALFV